MNFRKSSKIFENQKFRTLHGKGTQGARLWKWRIANALQCPHMTGNVNFLT